MKISLDNLEIVVKGGNSPGDPVGGGGGAPGGGGVHIITEPDKQDDRKDGKDGGSGGQKDGKGGDIRKIKGPIGSHDEMVDGDQDLDVLDGSDQGNDSSTDLEDVSKLKGEAKRQTERQAPTSVGSGGIGRADIVDAIEKDRRKDYKQILRELFNLSVPSKKRSHAKGDSRTAYREFPAPGKVKKKELNSFMLALDTSGSITPRMISRFIGTAQNIAKRYANDRFSIRIVLYVEKVYKVKDFKGNEVKLDSFAEWLRKNIDTSGGNFFSNVANYINNMKDIAKYKGIIYLTDGEEVFKPFNLPPIKNIFLIDGRDIDLSDTSRFSTKFLSYVQKQTPGGKKVDIYQINI